MFGEHFILQQGVWPGSVQKQFTSSENQHSRGTWCLNAYLFPIGMVAVQGAMVIFQTFGGVIAYGVTLNYRFHLPTEDGCCLCLLSLMNIIVPISNWELHCYSKTSRPSRVAWDYLHFLSGWCLVMSKWATRCGLSNNQLKSRYFFHPNPVFVHHVRLLGHRPYSKVFGNLWIILLPTTYGEICLKQFLALPFFVVTISIKIHKRQWFVANSQVQKLQTVNDSPVFLFLFCHKKYLKNTVPDPVNGVSWFL